MNLLRSLAVLALIATSVHAQDDEKLLLSFQVRPGVKAETLAKLARLAVVQQATVSTPTTVGELLKAKYGSSHQRLRDLFAAYNPSIKSEQLNTATQSVALPAAPEWRFDVKARVSRDVDIAQLALLKMGVAGPITKNKIASQNHIGGALASVPSGTEFTLPYVAPVVSFEIKPELRAEAAAILEDIKKSDPAVQMAEVTKPFHLVPSLTSYTAASHAAAIALSAYSRPLPVTARLRDIPRIKSTIAVLDSGIINDSRFDNLWTNPRKTGNTLAESPDYYIDDLHGYDFVNGRGTPLDDLFVPELLNHGSHVAGIASQRLAEAAIRSEINDRVDLMILKVADSNGGVTPEAVSGAVVYAIEHGARIANMSFAGNYSATTRFCMQQANDILFVVASGNATTDVDVDTGYVFPAKLASALPNVISVAALDSDRLAEFSNFGLRSIDIASPGVEVESTVTGGTLKLSGSSQAAPFVAYAAALLRSAGFKTPSAIKRRLMDSADISPFLRGKVASEGVLDIEKALLFSSDLVEKNDHTILAGRITAPQEIQLPNGQKVPLSAVEKVSFNYSTDPNEAVRIVWGSTDGSRRVTLAPLSFHQISVEGIQDPISVEQVRDLVRETKPR